VKVYNSIEDISPIPNAIVTSGTFDGIHLGHQKILKRLVDLAKKNNGESVLFTFHPHPRHVLFPSKTFKLLSTLEEKKELLAKVGIDRLIIQPFTAEFSKISSDYFIREFIEKKIGAKRLVIGYDHKFGNNREGSFDYLNQNKHLHSFDIEEIKRKDIDHIGVSSTAIRKSLAVGEIKKANSLLGRLYSLTGVVVKGKQIGRTIGFPTANLDIDKNKLIPANGSYTVKALCNGNKYGAMLNVGNRPTLNGNQISIEVHIFDFNQDIYEQTITIEFIDQLREERKFDSIEALQLQLQKDKKQSLENITDYEKF